VAFARGCLWLAVLIGLSACSEVELTENSTQEVTVHYYGVIPFPPNLEDATAAARKACAAYGKTANLRKIDQATGLERFAHFTCVGG
jgi:hypothetical protein